MPAPQADPSAPDQRICPACNYRLEGLAQQTCPECGRTFDPELAVVRRLLPWERPAGGGPLFRCLRTVAAVTLRPIRTFTGLSERKHRPIGGRGSLLAVCVIAAAGLHLVKFAGGTGITWLRHASSSGARAANRLVGQVVSMTWPTDVHLALWQILWMLIAILVTAGALRWLNRRAWGSLGTADLVALLAPVVPAAALIWLVAFVIISLDINFVGLVIAAAILLQAGVLLWVVWHVARSLGGLSRLRSAGLVALAGAACWGAGQLSMTVMSTLVLSVLPRA